MKHTALYLRVSTEAQAEEGYSLAAQAERLEAYCRMKGAAQFKRYVDGGFSGSNLTRPAMSEMIAAIRDGAVERVVVYKLDRLSRSQKDTLYLIEDVFMPHGVDFVSINENIDTGSPYGRAMIGILSAFAQLERENIFLRTRMGMVERVKAGYWPGGGKIPFGYDYDAEKGILVPNSDADTVREIYDRYLAGQSAGRIARELGLRYEQLVRQILERESNTGVILYRGERYQGRHEPLVTPAVFEQAQRRLHRAGRPRAAESGKLLTGLLVCGHCGAKMRYQKWGKAGDKLVCYSRDKSKPHLVHDENCPNRGVMACRVEEIVIRDLSRLAAEPELPHTRQTDEAACRRAYAQAQHKLRRLYELYAEAEDDTLREAIARAKRALDRAERALQQTKRAAAAKDESEARRALQTIGACWAELDNRTRQALIRACVDKIVLQNDRIEVFYTIGEASTQAG
ncbi:MAG: recombinase family protein [Agathobaculum sp.]|jgi:site-specific DNA recombinase|uniref:recombinase family protein n=1 Tax=Agathobaculum sp. TaxID=2048138 RepID=UPI003D9052A1